MLYVNYISKKLEKINDFLKFTANLDQKHKIITGPKSYGTLKKNENRNSHMALIQLSHNDEIVTQSKT